MRKGPLNQGLPELHAWRKYYIRACTAVAMVAPSVGARVRFNRMKGVRIGSDAWVGFLAYLEIHHSHPDLDNSLVIGDHVAIGNNVSIYTHDALYRQVTEGSEPVKFGRVEIGDHVVIAPGSFLCNCIIRSHSIVAPLSVVVNSAFPPYSLIAGNPAKRIKDIRDRVESGVLREERP